MNTVGCFSLEKCVAETNETMRLVLRTEKGQMCTRAHQAIWKIHIPIWKLGSKNEKLGFRN